MEDQTWNYIIKRLTGVETKESKLFLDQWLSAGKENIKRYNEVAELWALIGAIPQQAAEEESENILVHPAVAQHKNKSFKGIIKYGVVASFVVFTSLSVYYLSKFNFQVQEIGISYTIHKAINGKVMKLTLPDNSTIWLNSGSEVSYSKDFNASKIRTVRLIGEAFFEVKHSAKQPFVVETGSLKTIVYGTSFNISSYHGNKQSSVAVKTGKVGVLKKGSSLSKATMLLPGYSLVYDSNADKLKTTNIDVGDIANWINGGLLFDQASAQEVFATLERKYDVAFNFKKADLQGCKITAKFANQSLETILTTLSASLQIKFNKNGKTIAVKGGQSCK